MKMITSEIVIIGAGLTGLTLAYLLRNSSYKVHIIEARDRLGGRILTSYQDNEAPIEMGATWLNNSHSHLNTLLEELKIGIFKQELGDKAIYEPSSLTPHQLVTLPHNSDSSYRIKGGSSLLINKLAESISEETIFLNEVITSINEESDRVIIKSNKKTFSSKIVISTLPPYLLQSLINITPCLPSNILEVMESTHTWMGESIKIGLRFKAPFWRANNSSGTIFSNVGPIPEFYDHSNYENNSYALKGFLNNSYFELSKKERLNLILNQLRKYYGDIVDDYTSYEEKVWRKEIYTHSEYNGHILPHQNNGHHLFKKPYLNNKLYIVGAETSTDFSGYMEGAIRSAYRLFNQLITSP
jgi:monoamine oxidase